MDTLTLSLFIQPENRTVEALEASDITLLLLPELLHVLVGAHFDWKKDKSQSPNLERMNHDDQRTMPIRYLAPKTSMPLPGLPTGSCVKSRRRGGLEGNMRLDSVITIESGVRATDQLKLIWLA